MLVPAVSTLHTLQYAGARMKVRPKWSWLDPGLVWNDNSYTHWGTYLSVRCFSLAREDNLL